jgi:hypothetical protein
MWQNFINAKPWERPAANTQFCDAHKKHNQQHEHQALISLDMLCHLWMHGGGWNPFGKSLDVLISYRLHSVEVRGSH